MAEKPYYSIQNKANNSAEVWIYEQIGEDWFSEGVTAKRFCQDLAGLKAEHIDLHINSPGGSVFDGQAIYNALVRHPASVTTHVDGLAASIASVIALAGDSVVMADNALFMIHNPWGFAQGSADDMRKCAEVLDKCRDTIVSVYKKKCGMTDAAIMAAMDAETWYTAAEAQSAGFVDSIATGQKLAASAHRFDFKALGFRNPPRADVSVEVTVREEGETECTDQECYCTGCQPEMACPDCDCSETCINPNKSTTATAATTNLAPQAKQEEVVPMSTETTAPVNGAQQAADIVTLCVSNGCADKAAGYISAGLSADQVGRKILEAKASAQIITPAAETGGKQRIEVAMRYNPKSLLPFASFGARQDQERAAHEAGMWARAVIFDDPKALAWCRDSGLDMRFQNAVGESSGATGGYLVPDSMESAIIDVRQQYGVARALCRVRPMGTAGVTIPVKRGGTTAYFQGDRGAMTESEQNWGQAQLVAKNLNALTKVSSNIVEDAIIDIAADVANDHGIAFATKEDACMVIGDGSSAYGGIVGINTLFEADATLKGRYAAATNTDTFSEIIVGELAGTMGLLQRNWRRNAFWLASSVADDNIFSRLLLSAGGNTTTTLQGLVSAAFAGKPREINEYMPSDPTADLTSKVILLYGDFSAACVIGDRRGINVQVLRERYADENCIGVIATERIDMNFREAVGTAAKPGPVIALIGG